MGRRARFLLVLAFVAAALLASHAAAASAGFSAGAEATPAIMHALRRVEDDSTGGLVEGEAAEAYPRRRALYDSRSISYRALAASAAACYGPCPARGQAYSRGCQAIYQCRG